MSKTNANLPLACLLLLVLAACKSVGPDKLVSSHQGYNDAVQLAMTRDLLTNIVRLRFGDPVQFLGVDTINAQFSTSVGAQAGASNIGGAGAAVGSAGGNVGYSDSPTITFRPRGDAQFIRDLLLPIKLEPAIGYTMRGDRYDRAFFTFITSGINDAPDLEGPNGDLYRARVEALSKLLIEGRAWLGKGKRYVPKATVPIDIDRISAFDHVWAQNIGLLYVDAEPLIGERGKGKALLVFEYHSALIVVRDPEDAVTQQAFRTLGLEPGHREYEIRHTNDEIALGRGPTFLWLSFRSLKELMTIASEYVEVPPELDARGIAMKPRYKRSGSAIPLKVQWSKEKPDSPYAVSMYDYWFTIRSDDHQSKAMFEAINDLFYMQLDGAKDSDTLLTLPLAGGR
jgi:hypothetical protein